MDLIVFDEIWLYFLWLCCTVWKMTCVAYLLGETKVRGGVRVSE